MNTEVRSLEPQEIWGHFADLNAVPRASKKEERVIQFMVDFGASLGLKTIVDEVGNVIICKPATKGMEGRKKVVMQSHLDMVHQKNADTDFDFDTQGIEMFVDGDWVKAKGTTLGADNGLGVATIMAVLASKDLPHPAIEALFTIDEETGMTGALGLKGGLLTGDILLNLDTEEDDEIGVGCAGGIDITATRSYAEMVTPEGKKAYKIVVKGLNGGHSGMDIIKGLGNANKIMNRLLYSTQDGYGLHIHDVSGGSLRNAIPRESSATVVVCQEKSESWIKHIIEIAGAIKNEYSVVDPGLHIEILESELPEKVMTTEHQGTILKTIYAAHNGVYTMSASIPGLVETSNNVAKVVIANGSAEILCLTRSSVESSKTDLSNALVSTFELGGCKAETSGDYPGWEPNMDSSILKVLEEKYKELNGEAAHVAACHAGLECGILGTNYPEMEMISFGPTIKGAHSPDERASISSVKKYWNFVKEILKDTPVK